MEEVCAPRPLAPRARASWVFMCLAHPLYFVAWALVPPGLKDELETNGGLPCEGGGLPGPWCEACRFGEAQAAR